MSADTFILENTRLLAPPLVPEVQLHLAEESMPIWQSTEDALQQMNLPPPYWAFAWAGGQALARFLLDNPQLVSGRTIVDLGAGSGIAAIAAKKAGAAHVLAADIDAFAIAAIGMNARANAVELETTISDLLARPPQPCDVLLVGDLFYERPLADAVLRYARAAHAEGADVLVGDPRRSYFPTEAFTQVVQYAVPVTRDLEDAEIKHAAVWRLAP